MDGTRYEPALITVKKGESVTWVNKDPFPHTATAAGTFDSKSIAAGKSWPTWRANRGTLPTFVRCIQA